MGSDTDNATTPGGWGLTEYLLLTAFLAFLYSWFTKKLNNLPAGPKPLPIIGNLHQLSSLPHEIFNEMRKKYGDMFSIYFASYPAIVLNNAKLVREAFAEPAFAGRANFLPAFKGRSGGIPRGLIFTHENTWIEQRRFALKTLRDFGFGKKSMEALVLDEANELIETFRKTVGKPIQTQNKFNAAVLNALWQLVSGNRYSHDDPELQDLIKRLTTTVSSSPAAGLLLFYPSLYTLRKYFPKLFGKKAMERSESQKRTLEFIKKAIKEHQDTFQPHAVPRDFIDVYLAEMEKAEEGSSFQGEEGVMNLMYTLLDLFVAGAETTSTTLTWLFLVLARNPDKQKKLQEEIDNVVGTSRSPSLTDRPNMPYTEATTMEVMRYSSIIPVGVFHASLYETTFNGYTIPKHTIIVSNLFTCMRDPDVWGDPDTFRPERFLSPDGKTVIRHEAHLPFSTGRRVCLGESLARDELFLFTTSLCQRFRITPDPNGPPLMEEYHKSTVLIPKPHDLVLYDRFEE